uniref:Uncharacterized protein n=2 Tax=Avena sativa TaxID=4498 RepID=A0ACD5ZIU9_AVESA
MKLVCRTDLLTTKMLKDTNPAQDTVHVLHEDASYDKDVLEIKLADSVVTSDYGGNFVKDVCIDDGQRPTRKLPEEKVVDGKLSPKFDHQMIHANGAPISGEKDHGMKSVHELKPEIVQPVGFAPDSSNEKLYSSRKEQDREGRSKATNFGEISEKKISLEELLRLESAEESQHKTTASSETSKDHMPSLAGEAVGQVSTVTTPEERDAEAPPECSTSAITDAASTEPTCTLEKTDDDVSAEGFDKVEKAEPGVDAPISSSSDIGSSEKSSDENGSTADEAVPNKVDETAVASTSSADIAEPSGANGENKQEADGITDAHDSTKRDEGNAMNTVIESPTQAQVMDEEITPDSAKATSQTVNGYPPSEPGLFGPSIMSAPVSHSGHLAYSGSISIRSDSSTTSTRSFAFPVLQRDWISSPVRMAKGERRRARRRHAWRKGLICCKF